MESPFLWRLDYSTSACLQGLPGHLLECRIIFSPRGVSPLTGITHCKWGLPRVQKKDLVQLFWDISSLPAKVSVFQGRVPKIVAGWALLLEIFLFVLCFGTVLLKVTDSQAQFLCPPLRGGICSHSPPPMLRVEGSTGWHGFTWEVWGLMLQWSIRTDLFLHSGCSDQ